MSERIPGDESTDEFWRSFADDYWEKRPVSYAGQLSRPIDPDELFDAVVRCRDSDLARPMRVTIFSVAVRYIRDRLASIFGLLPPPFGPEIVFRFFIERKPPRLPLARKRYHAGHVGKKRYLPRTSDRSFAGYHARIKRVLNPWWRRLFGAEERRYCLVINFPELEDRGLWTWEREFLRKLIAHKGINNAGTYSALFIGDYKKTPFGVHRDPESVFHIPIVGRKAMRTWKPEFIDDHPELRRAKDYDAFLAGSTLLAGDPGQFIYWPSCDWHIAESPTDGLSVSLALSLTVAADERAYVGTVAYPRSTNRRSPKTVPFDPDELQRIVTTIPTGLHVRPGARTTLTVAWLEYATAMGFINPPRPRPSKALSPEHVVSRDPQWPIVYLENGDAMLVAADGNVFVCRNRGDFKDVITDLNSGRPFTVRSMLSQRHGDAPEAEVMAFLEELVRQAHCSVAEPPES